MKLGIKKMTGRTIAFLFAAALLAACSGSGNATDGETQAGVSAVAVSEASQPIRISQGEPVELVDYMVDGEYVVFDFMSDYCPPCKQIAPWMDRLHAERDDVSVVKVDINRPGVRGIDWKSPVAAQFRLSSIPHFKVMDGKGAVVAEGDQAWQMVVAWLQELDQAQESQGR
jgi:thiol-disulfide isomerase/thioredoxin